MATAAPVPLGPPENLLWGKPLSPLNLLQGSLPGARFTGRLARIAHVQGRSHLRHLRWGCQKSLALCLWRE